MPASIPRMPRWAICCWALLFLALSSSALAIEIGDRVKVRNGSGVRHGTVLDKLGGLYKVRYDDAAMPNEEFVDVGFFVSDAQIEQQRREQRTSQLYQSLGRSLAYMLPLAAVVVLAVWYRTRKHRQPPGPPRIYT